MKKVLLTLLACAAVFAACKPEAVMVNAINLNETNKTMVEGDTYQLVATVLPTNADDKTVTWSPDNSGVVTVDANGLITAVKVGEGSVMVKACDGSNVSATCKVTVVAKAIPVTKIDLSYSEYKLKAGETLTIAAVVTPDNATTKEVAWSSSATDVASVDGAGVITAKKAGTANIVATATDNSGVKSDACVITVIEPKPMFLKFKQALMRVGGKTMTQEVFYGKAEEYGDRDDVNNPTWSSADAGVVSNDGAKFTAVAPGETKIKAADGEGNEIECAVKVLAPTVKPADYNYGISLDDLSVVDGWKTKDAIELLPGYVEGTQRIGNSNLNGYKLFEKNFTPVDASAIQNPALFLRLYISDISKIALSGGGEIELCSGGTCDAEELTFPWSYWCADATGAHPTNAKMHLQSGWNNIVLPFALSHQGQTTDNLGGFRAKHIDYLRIFQEPGIAKTGATIILDQARIIDWTQVESCDNFDMWYDRMTDNNSFLCVKDETDKTEGAASFAVVDHIIAGPVSNYRLEMWPGLEYSMPADMDTNNSLLKFDLYVNDGAAFKDMWVVFEFCSAMTADANGYAWTIPNNGFEWKTGWNEITLDFAAAGGDSRPESKRTVNRLQYFRAIFTPMGAPAKPYTYKIDNMRIVKK